MIGLVKGFFQGMPQNLRRITSGSGFIPEIDGLRFLAIVPVVLLHFNERLLRVNQQELSETETWITRAFAQGHIGVYLFFAISGFILALPFAKSKLAAENPVSLKKYYFRRLTRLEPPYLIIMTLLFLVLIFIRHNDFQQLFPHYVASVFYAHRLIYDTWTPINPPAWTLEIEVQFYILAPFLTLLYFSLKRKWTRRLLLVFFVVCKIITFNFTTLLDPFYLLLPFAIEFFLVGILIADIFLVEWQNGIPHHWGFDILAIASITILFSTWSWEKNIFLSFAFIISLFLTFYASLRSVVVNRILKNAWVTAIGGMCYTLYLLHLAFAEFFVSIYQHQVVSLSYLQQLLLGLVIFLPLLFLSSSVFFILVEKPCMDPHWPKKLRLWSQQVFLKQR